MGERRARWGYGYQDKVATERILNLLREGIRRGDAAFEGVRLADLEAGRVDDFVLVWKTSVEGHSIKWSGDAVPINWGELIGTTGLLKELADGYRRLRDRWNDKTVSVRLQTNRLSSSEKHHSQLISTLSVAEFLANHWQVGPKDRDSDDVANAWKKIAESVTLTGSAFSEFASSCRLSLGHPEPPNNVEHSLDARHYRQQFDALHKAIATWLTNNPGTDFIARDFLLEAIGYRSSRSGLIHRFPPPDIPYEKNQSSADRIKKAIEENAGGYIAVVGAAGVGKSTLVQDVLTGLGFPFFVPYYAFLPNTDGNRDRGEALTFFQDVVERFDHFSTDRHGLGISDLSQGRDALRHHMSKANERFVLQGQKTVLLIDGLDHVSREVNLQSPILHELPPPDEVPDGFLIVLSAQPQAFNPETIPVKVASAVNQSGRSVQVSGLSRVEVHQLLSRINKPTTGAERDDLFDACLGNPLILTYLLKEFERRPESTIQEAIETAGHYTGPMDQYYRERLALALQNGAIRTLLGLLCRAAPTIPVDWLNEWPEKSDVEDLYARVLAPFIRVEDGNVQFIHDSLVSFLKTETRLKLPGSDAAAIEREFHSILANRCKGRPCSSPLGRARILHLLRAEMRTELLDLLSSEWVREGIQAFLPYAVIHPLLVSGLNASWIAKEFGHVLRLILLDLELDQRTSRTDADTVADIFLALDNARLALSQVRAGGKLLVKDELGLDFASSLWWYANERNRPELKIAARTLYLQTKPISLIYHTDRIDLRLYDEHLSTLRAWSQAAPLFEDPLTVVREIQRLSFKDSDQPQDVNDAGAKASLLFRALTAALEVGISTDHCQVFIDQIETLKTPFWRFGSLLRLAEADSSSVPLELLQRTHDEYEKNPDIELAYAWFLVKLGDNDEARKIVRALRHIRFEFSRHNHAWGFSDITYSIRLRYLQELLALPEGAVPGIKDEGEEAYARVEVTARKMGYFRAVARGQTTSIEQLTESFRSFLLFHNKAISFSTFEWRNTHIVLTSKSAIYHEVARLATALGPKAIDVLQSVFLDLIAGPAHAQFTPEHRRFFARFFYQNRTLSKEEAIKLGLSSDVDTVDDNPSSRQQACFEIATFLHAIGDDGGSLDWVKRANDVSAGARSEKDYHMAHVAEWLESSVCQLDSGGLTILDKYARAVEVAGGEGTSTAAAQTLGSVLRLDPRRAVHLAFELVDRDVLNVAMTLESLIIGGAKAGATREILRAIYCELYSLVDPGDTSQAAVAVLNAFPIENRLALATEIMTSVRTNALPSHRVEVARALGDALRDDDINGPDLTKGLKKGRDDSSRTNSLYRLVSGDLQTIDEMAARLSDQEHPENWNPNPAENQQFDWWSAVKKARIQDLTHMNMLVSTFPPHDYEEVDLLAWKSGKILETGDRETARQLAEDAIKRARDASWNPWLDGAQKRVAYGALKRLDHDQALISAREAFGRDLGAGKLNSSFLLSDICDTFDMLEIEWPVEAVLKAISDYLDNVLAGNRQVTAYNSFTIASSPCSIDEALCRFVSNLLAFPVVDVGVAARRTLARYFAANGDGIVEMLVGDTSRDPIQLEHVLAAVHVGSRTNGLATNKLRDWILSLNSCDSIAVRSVAKRISDEQGWPWLEITNQDTYPVIWLPRPLGRDDEAPMLIGGDIANAWELYPAIFALLEDLGLDRQEMRSEFERMYSGIEDEFLWVDPERLQRWIKLVLARSWMKPSAIIGREAAMRVLGRRALSGQIPQGTELDYDLLYPIYDANLDLCQPTERPTELAALEWDLFDDKKKAWLKGVNGEEWINYPELVQGLFIIGERTRFVRPEWGRPSEERYRGLVVEPLSSSTEHRILESRYELTYELYLRGFGQRERQLIVLNSERQLVGPAYRWAAINSNFARALDWRPSENVPFEWIDSAGDLMVKSVYWKDGWISLEPPRFESLGEGWLVLATPQAVESIRRIAQTAELHLWAERHSQGDEPYAGKWHLSKPI
jgi:hypothetical protein